MSPPIPLPMLVIRTTNSSPVMLNLKEAIFSDLRTWESVRPSTSIDPSWLGRSSVLENQARWVHQVLLCLWFVRPWMFHRPHVPRYSCRHPLGLFLHLRKVRIIQESYLRLWIQRRGAQDTRRSEWTHTFDQFEVLSVSLLCCRHSKPKIAWCRRDRYTLKWLNKTSCL